MDRKIRVLCVDDHAVVRDGIEHIIGREADMEVVASCPTGREALTLFRAHRPDITLMDLQLGRGMDGVEAIRRIRHDDPSARVVVLTVAQGEEDIYRAMHAGAATYLFKDTVSKDLVRVVREVFAGRPTLQPDVAARLRERRTHSTLTVREIEVLQHLSEGLRNKEVASVLGIGEETVQGHVRSILSKLDAQDRTAAVHIALRRGIIHIH